MTSKPLPGVPLIAVDPWPTYPLSEREIQETLALFAHRLGKPVRVSRYLGCFLYSERMARVYLASPFGPRPDTACIPGERVHDEDGQLLCIVHHACVLILPEFTGQEMLARCALAALPHLDFTLPAEAVERLERLSSGLRTCAQRFAVSLRDRRRMMLQNHQIEMDNAARHLSDLARSLPEKRLDLQAAERLVRGLPHTVVRREMPRLQELTELGTFEDVSLGADGVVKAVTGEVFIRHNGHTFPMGRYEIALNPDSTVRIQALDEHPNADYPHPHVDSNGRPCLGNIAGEVSRLLARFRIGEALHLLHAFLGEYNAYAPFETIGHFDPDGEYEDEDDTPCENCDERRTPHCIAECGNNQDAFYSSDCCEYRTPYCYQECAHNGDACEVSPCDDCDDAETRTCYLDCRWNRDWDRRNPCDRCEEESCDECPYREKAKELGVERPVLSAVGS